MASKANDSKAPSGGSGLNVALPESKRPEYQPNPAHLDGVPDMSSLIYLEGDNILHNLGCRYKKDEIYTSISKVLLAVNPYQDVDIYAPKVIKLYRRGANKRNNDLPPHVFSVSQAAKYNLMATQTNQSMIVCGESGSGKTESAKHLMRYLAYTDADAAQFEEGAEAAAAEEKSAPPSTPRSGGGRKKVSIEKQVLDANPILESFGNAKTVLNNNSSRFGKFTKLVFVQNEVKEMTDETYCANINRKGCPIIEARIVGSFIETYLLEKSRVVQQDLGERNYHIFYALVQGGLEPALFTAWKLAAPDQFHYLRQSKVWAIDGQSDPDRFTELRQAMDTLQFSGDEQLDIFRIVAGILHLGNVNFLGMGAGGAPSRDGGANDPALVHPKAKDSVQNSADLWQVDGKALTTRLTFRNMVVRGQVITKQLSKFEAEQNRDAISKALYSSLFNYIVTRINDELFLVKARQEGLKWIGILDVFGFESFEHNSFEQFCINFCNERLQQYFNRYILRSEQDEYILEAIMWTPISVPDNQDTIDLVDKKTTGILSVLDSACKMPKGDDKAFIQSLFTMHPKHVRLTQVERIRKAGVAGLTPINGFSIAHYAGTVIYNAKEFLSKNADFTSPDTIALFGNSKSPIAKVILVDPDAARTANPAPGPGGAPATTFKSTGSVFSTQLNSLMTTLYDTTPHFVRCIKPNKLKKPGNFTWDYVRPQLECGGIIDALRILKCGYPTRCTYEKIFQRYGGILVPTPPNLNKRDFCEAILRCTGTTLERKEFQLGLTKVFFRPGKQAFLEGLLEEGKTLPPQTVKLIRRFLLNKRFFRVRGAIRCYLVFNKRLRQMRALRWVIRTFHVANVICGTMFSSLHRIRQKIAASALQSYIYSALEKRKALRVKKAVLEIELFYKHNKQRRPLYREVQKRIMKKRSLVSEKERKEKEARELARRENERKEKEERLIREKERRDREEKERLEAADREKERARLELLEREQAKEKERIERENRMAELQRSADEAKRLREDMERDFAAKELQRAARDKQMEQERQEREKQLAIEREQAVVRAAEEAKERERVVFEARLADIQEKQKAWEEEKAADHLSNRCTRGAAFVLMYHQSGNKDSSPLYQSGSGAKVNVQLTLTDDGTLLWAHKEEKSKIRSQTDGSLNLGDIAEVLTPGLPDHTGVAETPALSKQFIIVNKQGGRVTFESPSAEVCDEWATSLRYVIRNWRQLSTINRPPGDPARGNTVVAKLQYQIETLQASSRAQAEADRKAQAALSRERDDTKTKLDEVTREKDNTVREVGELKTKLESLTDEEKKHRLAAESTEQQLREEKRKVGDLTEQVSAAEKKVRESTELVMKSAGDFSGAVQDFNNKLKKEVDAREEQIASLKAKQRESEDEMTKKRGEWDRERKDVEDRSSRALADKDRDISQARDELSRARDEINGLRTKVSDASKDADTTKAKMTELIQELAATKGGRQALEDERTRTEKRMAELGEALDTLRRDMAAVRKEADDKAARELALLAERDERELAVAQERAEGAQQAKQAVEQARERERHVFEAKLAEMAEKNRELEAEKNSDHIAARLTTGAAFTLLLNQPHGGESKALYQAAPGPKPMVNLVLGFDGRLAWTHTNDRSPLKPQTDGAVSLTDVSSILTPGQPDLPGDPMPPAGLDRQFVIVLRNGGRVTLDAVSYEQCEEWATSLRYVLRNWRQLSAISRPAGDPARDNALATQLSHRFDVLEAARVTLLEKLAGGSEAQKREIDTWKEKLEAAAKDREAVVTEVNEWKAKLAAAGEEAVKLRAEIEATQQTVRERDRKITDVNEALAAAERKVRENNDLMMKNAGDINGMMADVNARLKRATDENDATVANLKKQLRELEDEMSRKRRDQEQQLKEADDRRAVQVAEKEREASAWREEKTRLSEDAIISKSRAERAAKELEEMKKKLSDVTTDLAAAKSGRTVLEEERTRTQQRHDEEKTRSEKKINDLNAANEALRKEIADKQADVDDKAKQLAAAQVEVRLLKDKINLQVLEGTKPATVLPIAQPVIATTLTPASGTIGESKVQFHRRPGVSTSSQGLQTPPRTSGADMKSRFAAANAANGGSSRSLTPTPLRMADGKPATAQAQELQRKWEEAKALSDEANTRALKAESVLDKRKESIKQAMKTKEGHEKKLKETEQTMRTLGFEGKTREDLKGDATATRLLELHVKEQELQAEAKAALLREYAAMVAEAEALNQSREELDKRAQTTAKLQVELDRALGKVPVTPAKPAGAATSATGAPGTPGTGATASSSSGAPAKLARGQTKAQLPTAAELLAASSTDVGADGKKDDGCVVM